MLLESWFVVFTEPEVRELLLALFLVDRGGVILVLPVVPSSPPVLALSAIPEDRIECNEDEDAVELRLPVLLGLLFDTFAFLLKLAVAMGTLSPNSSAFNIVENVWFASSSFLISISLSILSCLFLISGKISWFDKLNAACKSIPVRFGMYRSLNIDFWFLRLGDVDGNAPPSFKLGGSKFRVDLDGDLGVSRVPLLDVLPLFIMFLPLAVLFLLLFIIQS